MNNTYNNRAEGCEELLVIGSEQAKKNAGKKRKKATGLTYVVGSLALAGVASYMIPSMMRYVSSYISKKSSQYRIGKDDDDSGPELIKKSDYIKTHPQSPLVAGYAPAEDKDAPDLESKGTVDKDADVDVHGSAE